MAEDREVLREVWEGRLPVCFSLSPEDQSTVETPEPCYLLVPRMSYFPLVTDRVAKHFSVSITPEEGDELWLEYNGEPLRWHYPVGCLFDLLTSQSALPWNLTVHFKKFPEKEIIRCQGKEAVEANFMSAVKEADSLKHRSAVINSMRKNDHKQLWMGVCTDKFEQFWSVNKRLMERTNGEPFRCVPVRVMQPDRPFTQKLCRSVTDQGDLITVGDFLRQHFPHVIDTVGQDPAGKQTSLNSGWRLLIHGVSPPLDTPLQWMSEHLSHQDNFLYFVLHQL